MFNLQLPSPLLSRFYKAERLRNRCDPLELLHFLVRYLSPPVVMDPAAHETTSDDVYTVCRAAIEAEESPMSEGH
jgi:hypothetical protein